MRGCMARLGWGIGGDRRRASGAAMRLPRPFGNAEHFRVLRDITISIASAAALTERMGRYGQRQLATAEMATPYSTQRWLREWRIRGNDEARSRSSGGCRIIRPGLRNADRV